MIESPIAVVSRAGWRSPARQAPAPGGHARAAGLETGVVRAALALVLLGALASVPVPRALAAGTRDGTRDGARRGDSIATALRWPAGSRVIPFENLEGVILVEGTLRGRGGRDTTGLFVLDTGAGFLALDGALALALGIADSIAAGAVEVAPRPLPRLAFGGRDIDQVAPVLTVESEVVRRVTDRAVLGLIGQGPLAGEALWIDYRAERLGLIPVARGAADAIGDSRAALAGVLGKRAVAVPFRLAGDGKIMVEARVSDPSPPRFSRRLTLIVDTGATQCVLFAAALERSAPHAADWPRVRGLVAPTLVGTASACVARVPELELRVATGVLRARDLYIGVIEGSLGDVLSRATGETVHGLLGYSFLRRYRVTIDYPHRVLWLEPEPRWNDRPYEYCHVGIQIERVAGASRIVAVAERSPAEGQGIAAGDEVVAIDGQPAGSFDIVTLARRLEGAPGTAVTLVVRRGTSERTCRLIRRRLL